MFQKIGQKTKYVGIAKLILRITFFNFPDVLNFIICMFSGTVDDWFSLAFEQIKQAISLG